jgi:hypothetical protein
MVRLILLALRGDGNWVELCVVSVGNFVRPRPYAYLRKICESGHLAGLPGFGATGP